MADSVTEFYDRLSPEYRDNMGWDWEAGARWQGECLDSFLANETGVRALTPCLTARVESAPKRSAWHSKGTRCMPPI